MMNITPPYGRFAFLAPSLLNNTDIATIDALTEQVWLVYRANKPPFSIGFLSRSVVTLTDVAALLAQGPAVNMVVNVPKECRWDGAAIQFLESQRIVWGGVGDIHRVARKDDVRDWKHPTRAFVERALAQHDAISALTPITDKIYLVSRHGMPDIRFVMIHEYTLTGEHVRYARDVHGVFDEILNTDPNGGATAGAKDAAKALGVAIFSMRTLMGRLSSP